MSTNQNNRQSMAHVRTRRRRPGMDKTTKILLISFAVVGIVLAFFGGKLVFNMVKSWSMTNLPGAPVASDSSAVVSGTEVVSDTPLQSSNAPAAEAWDGKSRINILLLGLDYSTRRQANDQGSPLSDTMILLTVDPISKTMGVMSLRRDLWVNIPGFDYNKINSAYKLGEDYDLPEGGAGLAMDTVEEFLGVPINYYAKVEFSAFTTLIDEIGGVTITLTQPMTLDWRGKGEKFTIEPGTYVMPGTFALAYARTRDAAYGEGDIARGGRQMEVILAIRDRLLDVNNLANLISRAPALYQEISGSVTTNMSLTQAIQLVTLMASIPRENMTTYNITYDQAEPQTNYEGVYILRPIDEEIQKLRDQMFVNNTVSAAVNTAADTTNTNVDTTLATGDPLTLAIAEGARIEILNGTSTGGLAETTSTYLVSQGLNVTSTGNSDSYSYTTIVYHNAKPYAGDYLASLMQVPSSRILNQYDPNGSSDITVYLGEDWGATNPMQ